MKLYKYWKVFLGIGILFTLSIFSVPKVSFAMIPNIIFAILFLYLGITQKKKAFADPDYVEEMERRKQEKVLAEMSRQERYKDAKQIHTRLYLLLQNCNLHSIEKCPCAGTQGTLISECYDIQ